ncbi:MAG: phosphoserine phosphatase SerB [Methylocella sp.]
MTHVATLVCNPRAPILTEALARRILAALPRPQPPYWLDPGIAADIAFAPGLRDGLPDDLRELTDAARNALDGAPVDIIVQCAQNRRKKLLAADMDSTMISQECIDELAAEVGLRPHVAAITVRAMRGEIAFEPALRERVALLAGLHRSVIAKIIETAVTLTPGARTLVRTMRRHGARTVLVSGGFTAFTTAIGEMIGFDADHANELEFDADGRITGRVAEPVLGEDGKLATLRRLRAELGLTVAQTLAVGDGANDLAMLREAGLGVAFHGKPAVAAAAHARVDHADLTALLYAQGFTRGEFVEDPQEHCERAQ